MSHESVAEQVLAEVQAQTTAQPETAEAPTPDGELAAMQAAMEEDGAEEATPDEAPRKRGLSWEQAVKSSAPDVAAKMREMHASFTRSQQELAELKRGSKREIEAMLRGKEALTVPDELPEYDPFNAESMQARIKKEATLLMREMLEPMQAEYEQMQAADNYKSFLQSHPDFETDTGLRSEVQHLLELNGSLDLETAYWAAKGKQAKSAAAQASKTKAAKRRAAKEAALKGTGAPRKGGRPGRPKRGDLRNSSAADILAMAQAMHRR